MQLLFLRSYGSASHVYPTTLLMICSVTYKCHQLPIWKRIDTPGKRGHWTPTCAQSYCLTWIYVNAWATICLCPYPSGILALCYSLIDCFYTTILVCHAIKNNFVFQFKQASNQNNNVKFWFHSNLVKALFWGFF